MADWPAQDHACLAVSTATLLVAIATSFLHASTGSMPFATLIMDANGGVPYLSMPLFLNSEKFLMRVWRLAMLGLGYD